MTIKVYVNQESSFSDSQLIKDLLKEREIIDSQVIYLGILNKKKIIDNLLKQLEGVNELWVYDYETLKLTISEFNRLYELLQKHKINFQFINEASVYLPTLKSVMKQERQVLSERVKYSAFLAKQDDSAWGRPAIASEVRMRIFRLYHIDKKSVRKIASECDVSIGTVSKYINQLER